MQQIINKSIKTSVSENSIYIYNKSEIKRRKMMSPIYKSVDELVVNTAIVELTHIEEEFELEA